MKFRIQITEYLQRVVDVHAETLSEAIMNVAKDYENGEIILDDMDFVEYEINEFTEE